MKPITDKAYDLFHRGAIALAQVEANGVRIDVDYLNRAIDHTTIRIDSLSDKMKNDDIFKIWKKQYDNRTNLGSRQQLGKILFEIMDYECTSLTTTERFQCNETVLTY